MLRRVAYRDIKIIRKKRTSAIRRQGSKLRDMFEPLLLWNPPVECGDAEVAEAVPNEQPRPLQQGPDGAYLIDRDGHSFRFVLNFLRNQRPEFRNGVPVEMAAGHKPDERVLLPESRQDFCDTSVTRTRAPLHFRSRQSPRYAFLLLCLSILRSSLLHPGCRSALSSCSQFLFYHHTRRWARWT